jgi:hypothetical protein
MDNNDNVGQTNIIQKGILAALNSGNWIPKRKNKQHVSTLWMIKPQPYLVDNNSKTKQLIANYFCKLYHSKDITNQNKFIFGKIFAKNNDVIVIIYAKPRGDYFTRHFGDNCWFNKGDCDENPHIENVTQMTDQQCISLNGGFRIKWNVTQNKYQYVCISRRKPWKTKKEYDGTLWLYESVYQYCDLVQEYNELKEMTMKMSSSPNILSN